MTYKTSHYVANLCVHATSESQKPIVILFPHEVHLREMLTANASLPALDTDIHKLCEDAAVKEFYLKDLQAIAKKNGFKAIEVVQGVVLSPEEWTPESGLRRRYSGRRSRRSTLRGLRCEFWHRSYRGVRLGLTDFLVMCRPATRSRRCLTESFCVDS